MGVIKYVKRVVIPCFIISWFLECYKNILFMPPYIMDKRYLTDFKEEVDLF